MTVTLPPIDRPPTTPPIDRPPSPVAPRVTVVQERCAGCQECVVRCPTGAIGMDVPTWTVEVDQAACVGCRQCERTCPFSAISVSGPILVDERTPVAVLPAGDGGELLGRLEETRRGFAGWEDALAEASRCLQCPDPTCVRGCPVHNDIPGFVSAIRERDLEGAHAVLRRTTLLPDVCSRVCDQALQCEGACTWSLAGGTPVAIGALERFVADNAPVPPLSLTSGQGDGLDVAVVGSGPAGIAAAWELAAASARVTVFERQDKPGGLLGWGIPDFTLPADVAERPWTQLVEAGVTLRCGVDISPSQLDELLGQHDAVVLATGAGTPVRLPVEGGELGSVIDATAFLTSAEVSLQRGAGLPVLDAVRPGSATRTAPRVLVIGGGNTAMDVARSARRFGAEATCVEWMDARFAPVRPDELAEARAEGVEVRFSTTLVRLEGADGRVRRAHLAATRQTRPDKRPQLVAGSEETLEVDLVVMAMGYRKDAGFSAALPPREVRRVAEGLPDRAWLASGILAVEHPAFARRQPVGRLALGREVGRNSAAIPARERLWVAGDALVGPSTVVEAMAQGRRAAQGLLARLGGSKGRSFMGGGSARIPVPASDRDRAELDAPPPGAGPRSVLIAVESRGGHTRAKAEEIAAGLTRRGSRVTVTTLAQADLQQIAAADMLVVGTWVEGFVVAGVRPARATRRWLEKLPPLGDTPVAAFCTYGFDPKGALQELSGTLAAKGGRVVGTAAFGPRGGDRIEGFVDSLASLDALS